MFKIILVLPHQNIETKNTTFSLLLLLTLPKKLLGTIRRITLVM